MRLSTFIQDNLDTIVQEWVNFARTLLPSAQTMSDLALRDHSRAILLAIAKDMQTGQTEGERASKSKGIAQACALPNTFAAAHGAARHLEGLELSQLMAEYRAMRASVLALWRRSNPSSPADFAVEEVTRFNEGIDQALAGSDWPE